MVNVPSLPVEEPVFVFALALTAFLFGPLAIKRVGLPGIVSIVLIGALLGPNGLGIVEHSDAIVLLGEVGLIYLLFTVGLELDLQGFSKEPENAALFGLASFGIPFVIGTAACVAILGLDVWAAMLLAAVFASHTLLAYPVVNQLGVTQNRAVTAVFGGILFTDTLALFVLPLVTGAVAGGLTVGLFG
ncbi:MAG: cation:proton antiporter, partial [Halobacteriota archaeon]